MEKSIYYYINLFIFLSAIPVNIIGYLLAKKQYKRIEKISLNIATLTTRFLAHIIDSLAVALIALGAIKALKLLAVEIIFESSLAPALIVSIIYYSLFESSTMKSTPGKYLFGLQVVSQDGLRISFLIATLRYIFSVIATLTFSLGNLLAIVTKYNQTLHDVASCTLVVKKSTK